jgi:hypothetical protein
MSHGGEDHPSSADALSRDNLSAWPRSPIVVLYHPLFVGRRGATRSAGRKSRQNLLNINAPHNLVKSRLGALRETNQL